MDKIIPFSHKLLEEVVSKDDITIDMTCGNGFDTLWLSEISKKVYSFDIQEVAIMTAKKNVNGKDNIEFICDTHDNVLEYVKCNTKGVIYNLGYLPAGDKTITTTYESTISSLEKVLSILDIHGRVVLVCYPGCESGKKESEELDRYLKTLDQKKYSVITYKFINQINNPPFIYAVERDK